MRMHKNFHLWSTERISQTVLYIIVGIAVVVFALFFLVGYNMPSVEEPSFNAPLLTDALLILTIALVFVAAMGMEPSYFSFGMSENICQGSVSGGSCVKTRRLFVCGWENAI